MPENHDEQPEVAYAVGDVVSGTVTDVDGDGWLLLDVEGWDAGVPPQDLALADEESAQEHYTVGETVDGLFVWRVIHKERGLLLSMKRNAPGYVEALRQRAVGEVISATIIGFQPNGGLWLDVDGLVGGVAPDELELADGESARERYAVGETIRGLFVWQVSYEARDLGLSVKRNAPGYVEALRQRAVGEAVSATITGFTGNHGLWLDVDGLVGSVAPDELVLADGRSVRDCYAVGDTIEGLFVWQVNHGDRDLNLSVKRNAPGYVEALQRRTVGDVVSATVTSFQPNGDLWLDVDGLVGGVGPQELDLADGKSARDRYAVGETIEGLFVWQINHEDRDLDLSVKRNALSYMEALDAITRGDELDGIVAQANEWGIWLGAAGVVGWIPISELALNEEESPQTRYAAGDPITARVWLIDHEARDITLSVRRLAAGFAEGPISLGAEISVTVRGTTPRDVRMPIRVLTMYSDSRVEIPPHDLSLSTGMPRSFRDGETIRAVVTGLDDESQPTRLSHRLALDGWGVEMRRLSPEALVPNARPVPPAALSDAERRAGAAAVDLGPIIGIVPEEELDRETGRHIATYNETYRVVVESMDYERRMAIVSHGRFEERWRELAAGFEAGAEVDGELRDFDGETALLDLGSGLLARMPARDLPDSDPPGKAARDRIGEPFPLRITAINLDQQTVHVEHGEQPIVRLINQGESERLEFKATLKRSPRTGEEDKGATFGVMKSIVGFLNSWDGGTLLVGIDDKGIPITGPNDELGTLAIDRYTSEDEMIRALKDLIRRRIGASVFKWLTISFTDFRNTRILRVDCEPADSEVWLKGGKSGTSNQEEFFLRTPAATDPLDGRELVNYIQRRFPTSPSEDN